jgi:Reverse transcriptase (RNA-dependent DNA polymerase)
VKHKWVFDIKRSGIFRARLVACGYSQVAGIDFTQVFSPVCNDVTFQVVLICMIVWGLFDVVTAFLTGNLEEEMYMECPEGLEHEDDEILQLLKAIYGSVQASRQYNKKFTSILKTIGFAQC